MLKSEVLKFFPEPVFKYKFEKAEFFNQELAQYIYNLQKEDLNGLTKSNRGGWHSKDFKLSDPFHHVELFKIAEENIKDIELNKDDFKKYDFLLKLFDKADIVNQINLEKNYLGFDVPAETINFDASSKVKSK